LHAWITAFSQAERTSKVRRGGGAKGRRLNIKVGRKEKRKEGKDG